MAHVKAAQSTFASTAVFGSNVSASNVLIASTMSDTEPTSLVIGSVGLSKITGHTTVGGLYLTAWIGNPGVGDTLTLTGGGGHYLIVGSEESGVLTTSDGYDTGTGGDPSVETIQLTPSGDNGVLYVVITNLSNSATLTPEGGWTLAINIPGLVGHMYYRVQTTAAAEEFTGTWSGACTWAGNIVAVLPAGGGGDPWWGGSLSHNWNRLVRS